MESNMYKLGGCALTSSTLSLSDGLEKFFLQISNSHNNILHQTIKEHSYEDFDYAFEAANFNTETNNNQNLVHKQGEIKHVKIQHITDAPQQKHDLKEKEEHKIKEVNTVEEEKVHLSNNTQNGQSESQINGDSSNTEQSEEMSIDSEEEGDEFNLNTDSAQSLDDQCKNSIQKELAPIKFNKRKDKVLKALLRDMRRFYKKKFLTLTKYNDKKRRREKAFLLECLEQFIVDTELLQPTPQYDIDEEKSEFVIFLGSMFYPKDMKKISDLNTKIMPIPKISKVFNQFSVGKLDFLNQFKPFRILLLNYLETQTKKRKIRDKDLALASNSLIKYFKVVNSL